MLAGILSWAGTHAPALRPAGGRRRRIRPSPGWPAALFSRAARRGPLLPARPNMPLPCHAAPCRSRGSATAPHRTAPHEIIFFRGTASAAPSGHRTRTTKQPACLMHASIGAPRPATPAPDPSKAPGPCPGDRTREAEAGPGPPTPIWCGVVWCAEPIDAHAWRRVSVTRIPWSQRPKQFCLLVLLH